MMFNSPKEAPYFYVLVKYPTNSECLFAVYLDWTWKNFSDEIMGWREIDLKDFLPITRITFVLPDKTQISGESQELVSLKVKENDSIELLV